MIKKRMFFMRSTCYFDILIKFEFSHQLF